MADPSPASAQEEGGEEEARAPLEGVRIEEPTAGIVPGPIVYLSARVGDPRIRRATLIANGSAYEVPVEQGYVHQQIVAVPGNNRVGLVASLGDRTYRDSVTFHYQGPAVELVVLLGWPSAGEIIDLWVREPGGETCKWDHRETGSGGELLDFSSDAIGFGSQGYVQPRVSAGRYRLKIHYWGADAHDDQRPRWDYEELLNRLDEVEAELARPVSDVTPATPALRRRLEEEAQSLRAHLDRWARPAAPQTPVHAEVVLFPGTPFERRWRFDRIVQRAGQLISLGEIEIDEALIRAARVARERD